MYIYRKTRQTFWCIFLPCTTCSKSWQLMGKQCQYRILDSSQITDNQVWSQRNLNFFNQLSNIKIVLKEMVNLRTWTLLKNLKYDLTHHPDVFEDVIKPP